MDARAFRAQQDSGAGLLADKVLRHFQGEYQSRAMQYCNHYLPNSFNIAEAFFGVRLEYTGFFLLSERDYLVSFSDFLDYVTGDSSPEAGLELGRQLPEDHIVNMTSSDRTGDLLLESTGHSAYSPRR